MTDIFLTASAADAAVTVGSGTKWKAGLLAGASSTHLNKNSQAAANPPIQMTDGATAGTDGTVVSWYTEPLQAVTIAGAITCSLWTRENATNNNVAPTIRIERCSGDGTVLSTIVSETTNHGAGECATTAGGASDTISVTAGNVTDTTLSDGDRLRITLWIDDAADQGGSGSMASGGRGEMWVNGPTGSAGQSRIAFTEVLSPVANLLAAYNFDEASGNILDVTGNGNDFAVPTGTARTTGSGGHTNEGIAPTTTVSVAGPSSLIGQTPQRTLMLWLKNTADFTGWIWEHHDNALDTGLWGLLCLSGNMGFRGRNAGGTTAHAAVARPTDNAWHHWAGTYDGVNVRTYLDGTLVATSALTGPIDTSISDVQRLFTTVGAVVTVDDLRVYDSVLTASEISTLKDTPVASAGSEVSIAGTLAPATASFDVTSSDEVAVAGTLAATTGSFAVTASTSGEVTLDGTLASITGSLAATASDDITLSGSLASITGSLAATASVDVAVSGSLAPVVGSLDIDVDISGSEVTIHATLTPVTGALGIDVSQPVSIAGALQSVTGSLALESGQLELAGSLAPAVGAFTATVSADVAVAGQLSPVTMSLLVAVLGLPRDLDVVVIPGLETYAVVAPGLDSYAVVTEGSYENYAITEVDLRDTWYLESVEYVDFSVNVKDADGGSFTQADVEGYSWKVCVSAGASPPDLADFIVPSETPVVTAGDAGSFDVAIRHLYTAAAKGYYRVWVHFGPTPESPKLLAGDFTVL